MCIADFSFIKTSVPVNQNDAIAHRKPQNTQHNVSTRLRSEHNFCPKYPVYKIYASACLLIIWYYINNRRQKSMCLFFVTFSAGCFLKTFATRNYYRNAFVCKFFPENLHHFFVIFLQWHNHPGCEPGRPPPPRKCFRFFHRPTNPVLRSSKPTRYRKSPP